MTPDRRQHIVRQPNGALVDEAAVRSWLAAMEVPARVRVARLSTTDPEFVPEWRRRSLARDMTEPVR